jgi:hypothetical protein
MSYRERQRLADIQAAIDAIGSHLQRGDLTDGLVFDGVRIRLLEMDTVDEDLPDLERAIQALADQVTLCASVDGVADEGATAWRRVMHRADPATWR